MRALPPFLFLAALAGHASAQELPPRDVIEKIIPQLQAPLAAAKILFRPAAVSPANDLCRMQNFEMTLQRDDKAAPNRYPVMLDPQPGTQAVPRQLLAVIPRLAVDADGAERAYHPEDVFGKGVCRRRTGADGKIIWRGVCALDSFASSGIRVFDGSERVKFASPGKSAVAAARWKDFWALIRDRKLKSFDFKSVGGPAAPGGYRMFYWKEKNLSAFFKRAIIPATHDGYPCLRGTESRYPGYFLAATTLTQESKVRPDGCAPGRYIDAAEIPFFVLPGGNFGHIQIGDIAIGLYKSGKTERVAYGITADAGPIEQFGEGSIAFNRILLGKSEPVMNIDGVYALDIDSERLRKEGATLGVLVLGGTRRLLHGDYSRENIEKTGRAELARWNGGGANMTARLNACIRQAKP